MSYTIDTFIKELQRISEDKRKLPLKVIAPNRELVNPSIKMHFDGLGSPLLGDKLIAMVISYQD
jgi:hypothetical protein